MVIPRPEGSLFFAVSNDALGPSLHLSHYRNFGAIGVMTHVPKWREAASNHVMHQVKVQVGCENGRRDQQDCAGAQQQLETPTWSGCLARHSFLLNV
jgi:hypothetical protein